MANSINNLLNKWEVQYLVNNRKQPLNQEILINLFNNKTNHFRNHFYNYKDQ